LAPKKENYNAQSVNGVLQLSFLPSAVQSMTLRTLLLTSTKLTTYPLTTPLENSKDPISVSRKFSKKFHDFFQTIIIKGQALGPVMHYIWKKEYQSCGAPHYHVLVWIEGASIIGNDPDENVLSWIQKQITCKIPDQASNPELVTNYQMHRCSKYCKRKKRVGGVYITRCKFGRVQVESS